MTGKSERTRIAAEHEAQRKAAEAARVQGIRKRKPVPVTAESAASGTAGRCTKTAIDGEFTKETARVTGKSERKIQQVAPPIEITQ